MKLGMVGLGRMGGNMAQRLTQGGHEVVGCDPHSDAAQVATLAERVMVPAGEATNAVVAELSGLLSEGDVIIDGGNSKWTEDGPRAEMLKGKGIGYLDCGVSGGVWGLTEGYALMVGGTDEDVAKMQPIFDALKPPTSGFVHAGPVGSGHFTKMVHNGIEYGMMQAYGEGWELLSAASRNGLVPDPTAVFQSWTQGTVVRSWLLDLLAKALDEDPGLAAIQGKAADSGEGRWTVEAGIELGVPLPVISASLFARFSSRQDDSPAMKAVSALRQQFGGHAVTGSDGSESATRSAPA
jgi:6-phosphogluconate dehydrogenase